MLMIRFLFLINLNSIIIFSLLFSGHFMKYLIKIEHNQGGKVTTSTLQYEANSVPESNDHDVNHFVKENLHYNDGHSGCVNTYRIISIENID
jgi:hypothetical protein